MGPTTDTYTPQARRILERAEQEALRFNHNYLSTEHLLLSLCKDEQGLAAAILRDLGAPPIEVMRRVEQKLFRNPNPPFGRPSQTARAKRVLELAAEEARQAQNLQVGPEHLLLGLVRETEGIAAEVLRGLNIDPEQVRARTIAAIRDRQAVAATPTTSPPTPVPPQDVPLSQLPNESEALGLAAYAFVGEPTSTWRSLEPAGCLDRFTIPALRVLVLAQAAAVRLSHIYVGTEHLLLGLCGETQGNAVQILEEWRVSPANVTYAIERRVSRGTSPGFGRPTLTTRAKKAIELATAEADRLGQSTITTGHLLLGLLAVIEGVAAEVLRIQGGNLSQAQNLAEKMISAAQSGAGRGTEGATAGHAPADGVAQLIADLHRSEPGLRLAAVRALLKLEETRAIEPLVTLLSDAQQEVRVAAADTLIKLDSARLIEALAKLLKDPRPDIRLFAISTLAKVGDASAFEPLIGSLKDLQPEVRLAAVDALVALGGTRASGPLIELLNDSWPAVQLAVVNALTTLSDSQAVEPLSKLLKSRRPEVRLAAVNALVKIGDLHAAEAIGSLLADPDPQVWRAAVTAVEKLKLPTDPINLAWYYVSARNWNALVALGEPAVQPLLSVLRRGDPAGRVGAAQALGRLMAASAVGPLCEALFDSTAEVRAAAAAALAQIGAEAAAPLVALLEHNAKHESAAAVLAKITDHSAVTALVQGLKHRNAKVRARVAEVMGRLSWPEAQAALELALNDADASARQAAAVALDKMGWKPAGDETAAYYYIAKRDWARCVRLGQAAVDPLGSALIDSLDEVRAAAADALGKIGGPEASKLLLLALSDSAALVRAKVVVALGGTGGESVLEPLVAALQDSDAVVRKQAISALGKLNNRRAAEPLGRVAVQDPVSEVRDLATQVLQSLSADTLRLSIFAGLEAPDVMVRVQAIGQVSQSGDEKAVDAIIGRLSDASPLVRKAAAEALGRIGDARAVGPLGEAMGDLDTDVRKSATDALVVLYETGRAS